MPVHHPMPNQRLPCCEVSPYINVHHCMRSFFNAPKALQAAVPLTLRQAPMTIDDSTPIFDFPRMPSGDAHKITQQGPRSLLSNVSKAARVAASNTSSTPSPVSDEHSRYFLAPISRAALFPSLSVVKFMDFFRISSLAIGSSRRSFFSPTRMIGTPGQRSLASSTH